MSVNIDLQKIKTELRQAAEEIIAAAQDSRPNDLFVLGCSTSEVAGGHIGKNSSPAVGEVIVETLLEITKAHGLNLVVQGCEHINRALSCERSVALENHLEIVNVKPALHAGGACSVAAWSQFSDPVCVEFVEATVGMDIGDTEIGMHIKHVQKPVRPTQKKVGEARVTALVYRPKLIGGPRATYL